MGLKCPHCRKSDFDSDWVYSNNLYAPGEESRVVCPSCETPFMVKTESVITHQSLSISEYEEFGFD